jgi:hypothetical protein
MSQSQSLEQHYANVAKARAEGYEVVYGTPRTLLLDLDTPAQEQQYEETRKAVFDAFPTDEITSWKSKMGHRHVVVTLTRELPIELRVALQVILGSDPLRGLCHVTQVLEGANPIALFKPREEK